MSRIIEIIVASNGQAKVETKGFAGSSCRQASKFIEDALGKRQSEQTTPEFYQVSHEQQQISHRGK